MSTSPKEFPADRFVRAAENWISKSASRFGVETPNLDRRSATLIRMAPFIFDARQLRVFEAVLAHLGKLADLLQVTIEVDDVPSTELEVYARCGYRRSGSLLIRRPMLHETMSPFAQWRRWWGNTIDGEMIAVPNGEEHDNYLFEHQDQFGIYDAYDWSDRDELLNKAYRLGWQAVLYDGSDRSLMLRYDSSHSKQYAIRRILQSVCDQLPVNKVYVDIIKDPNAAGTSIEIEGEQLDRFLKFGRLPRR